MKILSDTVYCVNCRFFMYEEGQNPKFCRCYASSEVDLVTGETKTLYASTCRDIESLCGRDGKWFELNESDEYIINPNQAEEIENV